MSLVTLLNDAHGSEAEGSVFVGVQSCKPEVRTLLLRNPELQSPARDAAARLRTEFPESTIEVSLDVDPDDAAQAIAMHLRVKGLSVQRRMHFYGLVPSLVPGEFSSRFVFLIDRI